MGRVNLSSCDLKKNTLDAGYESGFVLSTYNFKFLKMRNERKVKIELRAVMYYVCKKPGFVNSYLHHKGRK